MRMPFDLNVADMEAEPEEPDEAEEIEEFDDEIEDEGNE